MNRRQLLKSLAALASVAVTPNIAKWLLEGGIFGEEFVLTEPLVIDSGELPFTVRDCTIRVSGAFSGGPIIICNNSEGHVTIFNNSIVFPEQDCGSVISRTAVNFGEA